MLRSILINLVCAVLAAASNSLLKHTVQGRIRAGGSPFSVMSQLFALLQYPTMWLAICAFVGSNILWLYILSQQPISVAFPIQVSLVFVLTTLISVTFFAEKLTATALLGIAFVIMGIVMVGKR